MTSSDQIETEAPVRAAEVLSAVLAAFAIEQIAEGALGALTSDNKSGPQHWAPSLLLALALLLTLVRFFHGNSMYLRLEYARWSHTEVPAGSLVAPPIRYLRDVFVHILQYVAFISAAYFLGKCKLHYSYYIVLGLLGLDAIWTGLLWFTARAASEDEPKDTPDRTAPGKWAIINSISALVGLAAHNYWPEWIAALAISTILIAGFAVDYSWSYAYFFNSRVKLASFPINQPRGHLEHIVALYDSHDRTSLDIGEQLKLVFAFFMESQGQRDEMFLRKKAALTVGVYIEKDGHLFPLFRYYDKKIVLKNRSFAVGEHYLGYAYQKMRADPDAAISYASPDEARHEVSTLSERKRDKKQYRSSVVANIFVPGIPKGASAIGTLTVTSDQEDYFTPALHKPWAIALAREVGLRLHTCCLNAKESDILGHLRTLAERPITVRTGKNNEDA